MDMFDKMPRKDLDILCGASSYTQKYYVSPKFQSLPTQILEELQIICVTFTEDVGGVVTIGFNEDGELEMSSFAEEFDYCYDEIGAGLIMRRLERENAELFEGLSNYYRIKNMGYDIKDLLKNNEEMNEAQKKMNEEFAEDMEDELEEEKEEKEEKEEELKNELKNDLDPSSGDDEN